MVTDSIIRIGNHIYHLECQSSKDETMVIRMFEYDISIALEHASFAEHAIIIPMLFEKETIIENLVCTSPVIHL